MYNTVRSVLLQELYVADSHTSIERDMDGREAVRIGDDRFMTRIFVLHATEDAVCASRIRQDLTTRGYIVNDEVQTLDVSGRIYQHSAKIALLGSAAVILLWSGNAARNERIWNAVRFVQQLKRSLLPVTLDSTAFPEVLQGVVPTLAVPPYDTVVAALAPSLPPAQSSDPLFTLYDQVMNVAPTGRKEAIDDAQTLLNNGQVTGTGRDAILALLTCLAQDDPILSVRESAQELLDKTPSTNPSTTDAAMPFPTTPAPLSRPSATNNARFIFRCSHGHDTEFDTRELCKRDKVMIRGQEEGVLITCPVCHVERIVEIDCRGYQ